MRELKREVSGIRKCLEKVLELMRRKYRGTEIETEGKRKGEESKRRGRRVEEEEARRMMKRRTGVKKRKAENE